MGFFFLHGNLFKVVGRPEIDLNVCLDHTDLVRGLALYNVDEVVPALIVNVNGVTLEKARVVG